MSPEGWVMIIVAIFSGIQGILTWIDRKETRERDELAEKERKEAAALQVIAVEKAKEASAGIDKIVVATDGNNSALKSHNDELVAANRRLEQMIGIFTAVQAASPTVQIPVPSTEPIAVKTLPGDQIEVIAPHEEPLKVLDQSKIIKKG